MASLTLAIVVIFIIGYLRIATESITKADKVVVTLLMLMFYQTLFMLDPNTYTLGVTGQDLISQVSHVIEGHLDSTSTTLFFLVGAMTIIEVVDQNDGFNFVHDVIKTKSKRALSWRIAFMTFILSVISDNLTTSIMMIIILRKLVHSHEDRLIYVSLVIILANIGGMFSPISDATTIMLWNKGIITALGVMEEIFLSSVMTMIVPALIMQYSLKGESEMAEVNVKSDCHVLGFTGRQRKVILIADIGGLMSAPTFKSLTHLPPFVGILLVLGVLWAVTEVFYRGLGHKKDGVDRRASKLLSSIDMSTIPFLLGILMAVACLEEVGVLGGLGVWLSDVPDDNHYVVTGVIGVISSIVDNVLLVAGCMGMYPLKATGDMAIDEIFWQLLAYCVGVGESILTVGGVAGMVMMGLGKITFGWYTKHVSWLVLIGYLAGILNYWVIRSFIIPTP